MTNATSYAAVFCLALSAGPVAARKPSPAAPDLRGLITCERTNADWVAFGTAYGQPGAPAAWGWRKTSLGTGLLEAYTLKEPISVFGEKVTKSEFSGSGDYPGIVLAGCSYTINVR